MKKKHKGNLWAENSAIQILLSLIFKSVNQLCQFHRVSLDVLKALKKISVDFIVQCVWLLEHVKPFSYYAKTQRVLKHMDLRKIHRLKKIKKWSEMYLQDFPPSSTWTTAGSGPHCSGGGIWAKRRNVNIPQAPRQNTYKSFTAAQDERDFKPLGTSAALLDMRDLSDILGFGKSCGTGRQFWMCAERCRPSWQWVNV